MDAGVEVVASGGTARALKYAKIALTSVADITAYPSLLGGRVKTLHPAVHGGILSRDTDEDRAELAKHDLGSIDLVVCNLYPFQRTIAQAEVTFSEAIEQIDIGGVTLLRAAAKNCARVTVVCDPSDYDALASQLPSAGTLEWRTKMARKAFLHTAQYDAAIAGYFCEMTRTTDANLALPSRFGQAAVESQSLRYGENPHQSAALYRWEGAALPYEVLQGKALSYSNIVDLDGALGSVMPFEEPAVAIIKHTNPCGLAVGETLLDAYQKALKSDPVAHSVPLSLSELLTLIYSIPSASCLSRLAAPAFTPAALSWLAQRKKNCVRSGSRYEPPALQIRSTRGGLLIQRPIREAPYLLSGAV